MNNRETFSYMDIGKLVLIIDDDSRNIFALNLYLKAKGLNSVSASSAEEGIQLLESNNNIGIVLMDMMMPDMDGYEAIGKIKSIERYKRLPIIAVTAQAMQGDKEKCLQAGADDYISKPINVDKLMEVISRLNK